MAEETKKKKVFREEDGWHSKEQDAAKNKQDARFYQEQHRTVGIANMELNVENLRLEDELEDFEAKYIELVDEYDMYCDDMEKKVKELKTEIDELKELLDVRITTEEAVQLKYELRDAKSDLLEQEQENVSLKKKHKEFINEIDALELQIKEYEDGDVYHDMQNEIDSLRTRLEKYEGPSPNNDVNDIYFPDEQEQNDTLVLPTASSSSPLPKKTRLRSPMKKKSSSPRQQSSSSGKSLGEARADSIVEDGAEARVREDSTEEDAEVKPILRLDIRLLRKAAQKRLLLAAQAEEEANVAVPPPVDDAKTHSSPLKSLRARFKNLFSSAEKNNKAVAPNIDSSSSDDMIGDVDVADDHDDSGRFDMIGDDSGSATRGTSKRPTKAILQPELSSSSSSSYTDDRDQGTAGRGLRRRTAAGPKTTGEDEELDDRDQNFAGIISSSSPSSSNGRFDMIGDVDDDSDMENEGVARIEGGNGGGGAVGRHQEDARNRNRGAANAEGNASVGRSSTSVVVDDALLKRLKDFNFECRKHGLNSVLDIYYEYYGLGRFFNIPIPGGIAPIRDKYTTKWYHKYGRKKEKHGIREATRKMWHIAEAIDRELRNDQSLTLEDVCRAFDAICVPRQPGKRKLTTCFQDLVDAKKIILV